MRIGEAARMVGVSPATLRLWERQGILSPVRTAGGSRSYFEDDLAIIRRVRYLRAVERLNPAAIAKILRGGRPLESRSSGGSSGTPSSLGDRLRVRRKRAGLTLHQVGRQTGLSTSFLSALERGLSGVSIATLHKLAALYGTTVLELTGDRVPGRRLVRPDERPELAAAGNGVRIQQLALGQLLMEPQLFIVQPGAGSEGSYEHVGEELIFVLSGSLDIWLDEQEHYRLQAGDCLYFPSSLPHRWSNTGAEEAQLLWINTPPTF